MLQIRLNKGPSSDGGSGMKSLPVETVTVACPDHLVLADLLVAKGLGSATSASRVKIVGRRSRRQLGERVHFCVRCDFPIAIYGRLTPCEHAFCLDCARSDSICYLCDERIQKIQTIKLMEGIFICAAPHCLKSFVKKSEFESHIHGSHAELLQPNMKKEEVNELASESSLRPQQRPGFTPSSNPPPNDREDRPPLMQPRPDGLNPQNCLPQQKLEAYSDKPQQGMVSDPPHYPPAHYQQPPNFSVPINPGQVLPNQPPFGFPPFPTDGAPFYGNPMNYEVTRSDSTPEVGSAPPGFPEIHPHPWGGGPGSGVPYEAMQGRQGLMTDGGSGNPLDPQGRAASMAPLPPPGPPPPLLLQQKHDNYFHGDPSHDGKNYGWSQRKRDGFGST